MAAERVVTRIRDWEVMALAVCRGGKRMEKLRVALIGCGNIARVHARHLQQVGVSDLVAVCDVDFARAARFAAEHRVPIICSTIDEVLDLRPDVIHVLTPPALHADQAIESLNAGCHVYVEKPIATNISELEELQGAVRKSRATLCAGHSRLFEPPFLKALQLIQTGRCGKVLGVVVRLAVAEERNYKSAKQLVASEWQDIGIHAAYILQRLIGQPKSWEQSIYTDEGGDCAAAVLGLTVCGDNGLGSVVLISGVAPARSTVTIYANRLTMVIDFNMRSLVIAEPSGLPKSVECGVWAMRESLQLWRAVFVNMFKFLKERSLSYPGIGELVRQYHESILDGSVPPVDFEQAVKSTEWYVAILSKIERAQ